MVADQHGSASVDSRRQWPAGRYGLARQGLEVQVPLAPLGIRTALPHGEGVLFALGAGRGGVLGSAEVGGEVGLEFVGDGLGVAVAGDF